MTLTLELPPELEARVNSHAARRGLSPEECVLEVLDTVMPDVAPSADSEEAESALDDLNAPWPENEPKPTNGAELVAYWERHGLIGTRPDITDSLEHAREIRRKAERRDRS
jgi:hypothetical protein